jgi:hypothetical protein
MWATTTWARRSSFSLHAGDFTQWACVRSSESLLAVLLPCRRPDSCRVSHR